MLLVLSLPNVVLHKETYSLKLLYALNVDP